MSRTTRKLRRLAYAALPVIAGSLIGLSIGLTYVLWLQP